MLAIGLSKSRAIVNGPVRATNYCTDALYPVLKALDLPKASFKAFRGGRDERLILDGVNDRVRRQIIGHSSEKMTDLYFGEISVERIRQSLSQTYGVAG